MKRLLISAALSGFTLVATAQTASDSAVQIHGYEIKLPSHPYRMFPDDFNIYKGAYDLSNGETMVLKSNGRRMYAEIGDRPLTEMVAASSHEFVAVDRQFKININRNSYWGDVSGEVYLVVPPKTAQANAGGSEVVRLVTSH